ncbi:hypothetical protein GGX14DRAFT_428257 [Mycena pura]|uniref:Uncharacterized protein n=1 Tax=Mycena pura TaxID=153505 RepID=A0AAD6YKR3_9AGAR|nr:hypothetical protein GGX14DRAFT_428257 [Mycena pura]
MYSSLTFLLASAVAAQAASSSASAAASSPTSNPYIPTGISDSCVEYLQTFNDDTDLATCTSTLLAASSAFGPGAPNAAGASKDAIDSALTSICSPTTTSSCPQSLIAGKLATFYTKCALELTSQPNKQVMTMYDTAFALLPFLQSVCSKDDDGNYCVHSTNVSSSAAPAVASVARRDSSSDATAYIPNADTINAQNLVFLGITGSEAKSQLCTTCTRNVLTNYISFQNTANYAPGFQQSLLMRNEPTVYNGVVSTCGAGFLTNAVQAAGALGGGSTTGSSGALSLRAGASGGLSTLIGALVAVLIL